MTHEIVLAGGDVVKLSRALRDQVTASPSAPPESTDHRPLSLSQRSAHLVATTRCIVRTPASPHASTPTAGAVPAGLCTMRDAHEDAALRMLCDVLSTPIALLRARRYAPGRRADDAARRRKRRRCQGRSCRNTRRSNSSSRNRPGRCPAEAYSFQPTPEMHVRSRRHAGHILTTDIGEVGSLLGRKHPLSGIDL